MTIKIGEQLKLKGSTEEYKATVILVERRPMVAEGFGISLKITVYIPETDQMYSIHGIDKQILNGVTIEHLERVPLEDIAWRKLSAEEQTMISNGNI